MNRRNATNSGTRDFIGMGNRLRETWWRPPNWRASGFWMRASWTAVGTMAGALCVVLLGVFVNHLTSPEITRGVMIEGVDRLLRGLPLYPTPSGAFVPIDYNPLLTVLSAGFVHLLGPHPWVILRFVPIVGSLAAALMIFLAVCHETRSGWFGFLAAALFAGGYPAFDCYLDYANPDSWLLLTALLGLYLLGLAAGLWWNLLAITLLCLSFWFKQHGAFLAIAGVLYLTWRDGLKKSVPYWIFAGLLGPVAYFLLGPPLFGDHFIYYTLEVPRGYLEFRLSRSIGRPGVYALRHWPILAVLSLWTVARAALRRQPTNIWLFSFPFVLLMGFLGSLDSSENNVYIAPATWFIIIGVVTLASYARQTPEPLGTERRPGGLLAADGVTVAIIAALALSFAVNLYDPRTVLVSSQAWRDYDDLIQRVRNLEGLVYLPSVGQLPSEVRLPIPVQWVPLDDLVRGPGRTKRDHPLVKAVLRDLLNPSGNAYIISEHPLSEDELSEFLSRYYVLVDDFGDRYKSLRAMPGRCSGDVWPRYLYRFDPHLAEQASLQPCAKHMVYSEIHPAFSSKSLPVRRKTAALVAAGRLNPLCKTPPHWRRSPSMCVRRSKCETHAMNSRVPVNRSRPLGTITPAPGSDTSNCETMGRAIEKQKSHAHKRHQSQTTCSTTTATLLVSPTILSDACIAKGFASGLLRDGTLCSAMGLKTLDEGRAFCTGL